MLMDSNGYISIKLQENRLLFFFRPRYIAAMSCRRGQARERASTAAGILHEVDYCESLRRFIKHDHG